MLVAASDAAAVVQRINEGGDISRGSGVDVSTALPGAEDPFFLSVPFGGSPKSPFQKAFDYFVLKLYYTPRQPF